MGWWQVIFLSVVQGLTEFLPISSSGHLAIASRVFFGDDAGASFTAVSQLGTELAVLLYFARDIGRIAKAWFDGLIVKDHRNNVDERLREEQQLDERLREEQQLDERLREEQQLDERLREEQQLDERLREEQQLDERLREEQQLDERLR